MTAGKDRMRDFSEVKRLIVYTSSAVCPINYSIIEHNVYSPFPPIFAGTKNLKHVHVSGRSGPFIRFILENTMTLLMALELYLCNAEPQASALE